MAFASLEECLIFLEQKGQLIRIKEPVDPSLELAAIQLRVYKEQGPALLFENVIGCRFRVASNLFGTLERSKLIFGETLDTVKHVINIKNDPAAALKNPLKSAGTGFAALKALPLKNPFNKPVLFEEIKISDLPLIKHWPNDGGAFITLPQVYTEDIDKPGIMNANLGMYRIQLNGNDYIKDKEIGLHYQLHRGIGVHQSKANKKGLPLKVSIFVGGPPSHAVAAVMPLPEGISEMTFAGLLGQRRFHYTYKDGYCISTDADFVITGEVYPNENKPEGPFGDHLGYYSLTHDFPLMRVHKVYARKNAIWPFTLVGRPPQEDTSFGHLIHEMTGSAIQNEIPGLQEVNAVDAAGVHPLLLAIGSERYTPYAQTQQPAELLTIANHILGTGQLSLAKFLFITADDSNELTTKDIAVYLSFILRRIHLDRDVHFYTNTTIDTLDYSGTSINSGSKVVFAAYGSIIRSLCSSVPLVLNSLSAFKLPNLVMPGVIALTAPLYSTQENAVLEMQLLSDELLPNVDALKDVALIVITEDTAFLQQELNNFLWVTFTRCNPSHDIYGVDSFIRNKHWGCNGPLIIDARIKPHHAPILVMDTKVEQRIAPIFEKGGSLFGI